ncbi:MAG: sulfite exporter TauE/SafE family protein [Gammaproteobacteria bacterium]|nr:sulfite exporter TauE/SafE family protein [Gammaproteobacteria bacterium]MDP2139377.1 sulfite exporter TauE/SafE family protein [Gammaproteobacteria bacterium]MDP2346213.1 sulfite exporter TauE/SafE family protein [Gammaproteobacteria bacterium]
MEILLACLVIVLGAFVQTAIGFGLAVIAAPILYFIDPYYVPAPITVCALVLSVFNVYSYRGQVSFRGLGNAVIGRVPGSILGAALLLWIDKDWLALWIGLSVLAAVAVSMTSLRWQPTPGRMMFAGFMSGFMGTSSSIGGPPMALLWQHQEVNLIRANLSAFFVISCLMSLVVLAPVGQFGSRQILLSLPLLPATFIGFLIARYSMTKVPHKQLRIASLTLCSVCGLAAVLSFWL